MIPGSAESERPIFGVTLKLVSILCFVLMQTLLKAAGEGVPAGQLVFFRSFFALIPVVAFLAHLGDLKTSLRTDDVAGHIVRGVVGVTSMGLGFFAITRLPYPEWVTINYATPLLTVVFAAIFLKETVRAYRWTAVAIGLVGVAVVMWPRLSLGLEAFSGPQGIGVAAVFLGATFAAVAMIQVRRLAQREKTATIVLYFTLSTTLISLLSLPFGWAPLGPFETGLLVTAGILGGIGQLLLTAAYRYADTSTIAPFEYSSLVLAIIIGWVLFGETASLSTLAGGVIVIAAGIFIIWRESRLGIERRKARRANTN